MTTLYLSEISERTFESYDEIRAETPEGEMQPVWRSRRLPPFVGRDTEAKLSQIGVIPVPSLMYADLAPVYAKLMSTDPLGSSRVLRGQPE